MVFDRAVRDLVLGDKVLVEYRELPPAGSVNSYTVSYEIPYLDERLASVVFTTSTYTGGAHPNSARESLIFDLVSGRCLELSDIVTEPARAVEELAARCRRQLAAQATKEGWELFPDADFASVVRDIKSWAPGKDAVEFLFDPYSVAPHAVGSHECTVSYRELATLLKPDGPLPPP